MAMSKTKKLVIVLVALLSIGLPGCMSTSLDTVRVSAATHLNKTPEYITKGDYNSALLEIDQAIAIKPDYHLGYINRGVVHTLMRQYNDALNDYRKAIALQPDEAVSHSNYVNLLFYLRRQEEATGYARQFLISHPDSLLMKERLAMLLNFKENYSEAYSLTSAVLQQLETSTSTEELKYIVKDYLFAETYSLHGLAAAGLGKEAEAAKAEDKAMTYHNSIASCYYRAMGRYIHGNWQQAVNELNSGYAHATPNERDSPYGLESRFLLGNSYFKIGDMPQAKNAYETFLSANPFEPEAFSNLGLVYAKLGDNRQAISNYSSALKLDSNLLATLVNRGSAYMKDKRYDDAISDFSAVLARQPDNADVLYKRAYSLCASGSEPKAKKDLAAILQIEPGSVRAKELLGRCGGT